MPLVEDASGRIREERRRRLPVLGSCRAGRRTWPAFSFGRRFFEARDAVNCAPITERGTTLRGGRRDERRRGPKNRLRSALVSRVRLGAKALRCRERWCYRAMVPIPPNGPTPPSFPFALVLDLSSPPSSTFHLISLPPTLYPFSSLPTTAF